MGSPYFDIPRIYYASTPRLRDILVSVGEADDLEMSGTLTGTKGYRRIGSERKEVVYVDGVFPFQLAKRGKRMVSVDKRVFRRQIRTLKNMGRSPIGGYHSHGRDWFVGVTGDDEDVIADYMDELELEYWFEVIAGHRNMRKGLGGASSVIRMNGSGPEIDEQITSSTVKRTKIRGYTLWEHNGKIRSVSSRLYTPERI